MSDTKIPNRLLAALPPKEYKRLHSISEPIALNFADNLFEAGDDIAHVYFPESGIVSLLAVVGKDSSLEVGIVGREGMLGLPLFLGSTISRNTGVVQGDGTALRIRADEFINECDRSPALSMVLRRFANALISQISQSAVCFRYHAAEKRLARWLLMTADRMGSNKFPITQKFLSHMLGVRREAVTRCAGELQKRGLIEYSRGKMQILDRKRLEKASCPCYGIIKKEELSIPSYVSVTK